MISEHHPLQPFLPSNARLLMLGSFPPSTKRWSMDFYYPNWMNDMWRIWGYIYYGDKSYFHAQEAKRFDKAKLVEFLCRVGVALSDTAQSVTRLNGTASDKFLRIDEPTDVVGLLGQLPLCNTVAVTGEKACSEFCGLFGIERKPDLGDCVQFSTLEREFSLFRMPSSSRAYPKPIEWKAEYYKKMLSQIGML